MNGSERTVIRLRIASAEVIKDKARKYIRKRVGAIRGVQEIEETGNKGKAFFLSIKVFPKSSNEVERRYQLEKILHETREIVDQARNAGSNGSRNKQKPKIPFPELELFARDLRSWTKVAQPRAGAYFL